MNANTLFLCLEGPMQAWGAQESKFVIRRTCEAPTKSGVVGLLCAALGVGRREAGDEGWLTRLNALAMAVRIDATGVRWWDYHTIGARQTLRQANRGARTDALLSRREYLCDARFLVALQGDPTLITQLEAALRAPRWTLYLGRKCCPPARPLLLEEPLRTGAFADLEAALTAPPWQPRLQGEPPPGHLQCLVEWRPDPATPDADAPEDAQVWFDMPLTLEPPSHGPRLVLARRLTVGKDGQVAPAPKAAQNHAKAPIRPRADYRNSEYRKARQERLDHDGGLCVYCKSPGNTVQHITYRHAGGGEALDELRTLCRLCHDAVTMIEYGMGMGIDRINPEEPRWRAAIADKRRDIIRFRSLETRRRKLSPEEVE